MPSMLTMFARVSSIYDFHFLDAGLEQAKED
jgi:hypothetical protein